ncbi:MAG: cytochrome ubiquinol oxidase subunit I, partial [Desulfococcaceae bacterium]
NEFALHQFFHVIAGAFVLAGFFVMGISAYHLLKKQKVDFFTRSFRAGLVVGLLASIFVAAQGDLHAVHVAETQPTKLAAMEGLWETTTEAPLYLFSLADEKNERNILEIIPIPGLLSFLAHGDASAEVRGLKEFPREDRPPVNITSLSFKGMVALGTLFIVLGVIGWFYRNNLTAHPNFLKLMLFAIPLPYIANQLGWVVAEVGRQPWIVYGLMRTSDAASPVAASQVGVSLAAFILVYGLLGVLGFYLMAKFAAKGPEDYQSPDADSGLFGISANA